MPGQKLPLAAPDLLLVPVTHPGRQVGDGQADQQVEGICCPYLQQPAIVGILARIA